MLHISIYSCPIVQVQGNTTPNFKTPTFFHYLDTLDYLTIWPFY